MADEEYGEEDGCVLLRNPNIREMQSDVLYHISLSSGAQDLKEMFSDVKFICMGGTPRRMEKFAHLVQQELDIRLPTGTTLCDLSARSYRYSMYKIGPVISVSHGMGIPSLSILMHEMIKLMYHAQCTGVTFLRLGTCGGIGEYISDDDYVYSKPIHYSGSPILLAMWDRVYNQKEDDLIRSLQYDQTDIFLLCFSVTDKTSFMNAVSVWKPEIQKHCPKSPCILVGLKKDLRCSKAYNKFEVVTKSMGRDMAEKIGAVAYMECSAKRREGVKEVFTVAVQTAMRCPPPKRKKKSADCGSRLLRFIKLL